jgi:PAS domain S-box-containing protein
MKEESSNNLAPSAPFPYVSVIGWVVLICDLIVTMGLWYFVNNNAKNEAFGRFKFRSHEIKVAIKERLSAYEQVLKGGVGLFESVQLGVDREMFKTYVENLNIDERYPGIQGIGFSIPVFPNEIEKHIHEVRESGFPKYTIKPEGKRDHYTAIIYIEPFNDRNLRAFGYDMFSEPVRRNAMKRARDTGRPSITGRITLVQETNEDIQTGFLMYLPLYKKNSPLRTIEERRAALYGYIYSPFRTRDFLEGVLGQRKIPDMAFGLFDGNELKKEFLLYESNPDHNIASSLFKESLQVEFNNHIWSLELNSLKEFETTIEKEKSIAVLVIGLIVSLVFFTVLWLTHTARNRAVQHSKELANTIYELKESESHILSIQKNLQVKESELEQAQEIAHFGSWSWDIKRKHLFWSDEIYRILGLDKEELNPSYKKLLRSIHNEDRELVNRANQESLIGKNGYDIKYRILLPHGEVKYIHQKSKTQYDSEGYPLKMVGIIHDITERKVTEDKIRQTKNQLVHSEKLSALGKLTGSIAHEFNNPIYGISLILQQLSQETKLNEEHHLGLNIAIKECNRMALLISKLREFYKPSNQNKVQADINTLIKDIVGLVNKNLTLRKIELELNLAEKLPMVNCVEDQIKQVILNIINNAEEAILKWTAEKKITITTELFSSGIQIHFRDTGQGIPKENIKNLFDPFFTTRSSVKGSGLGLSISHGIIKDHGGNINAESNGIKGANFSIYLPIKKERI